jgi:hypothetical protein
MQQTSEDRVDAYLLARNGSDEPIYAVRAIVVRHSSPFSSDPEAALRQPGNYIVSTWDLFPPLQTHSVLLSRRVFPNWHVTIGLSFTDSQGRRWKRLPNGTLTDVTKRRRRSRKDYMNAWIAGELDHLDY